MKIMTIQLPALCQLPLIETPRPAVTADAAQNERRPAGLLLRIAARIFAAIAVRVPVGFEDETGFHYGAAAAPSPGAGASRALDRPADNTRLQARWRAVPARNFDSGGQLVLQWDSSSLPPCQLSPGSLSTKPNPRQFAAATKRCAASFTRTRTIGRTPAVSFQAGRWTRSSSTTSAPHAGNAE